MTQHLQMPVESQASGIWLLLNGLQSQAALEAVHLSLPSVSPQHLLFHRMHQAEVDHPWSSMEGHRLPGAPW